MGECVNLCEAKNLNRKYQFFKTNASLQQMQKQRYFSFYENRGANFG